MCMHIHIYIYIHIFIHVYTHVFICMLIHIYVKDVFTNIDTCINTCICVYIYVCVHIPIKNVRVLCKKTLPLYTYMVIQISSHMHIPIHIRMHIQIYFNMYVLIHIYKHLCMRTRTHSVYMCDCMHVRLHVHIVRTYTHACMRRYIYTHKALHTYLTYLHACLHAYTHAHTHTHTCRHSCLFQDAALYTHTWLSSIAWRQQSVCHQQSLWGKVTQSSANSKLCCESKHLNPRPKPPNKREAIHPGCVFLHGGESRLFTAGLDLKSEHLAGR